MFYSADVRHERFWRVGIARNAVFFHSFVASLHSLEKSAPKSEGVRRIGWIKMLAAGTGNWTWKLAFQNALKKPLLLY